jgi:GNAT superfamily N-acetyltransferase
MPEVTIVRGGAELLAAVRPLWLAMRDHHHQVVPEFGPVRDDEDSWGIRRTQYEAWLADGESYILLARDDDGSAVGYAFARVERGAGPTWMGPGHRIDLESLSVAPGARGRGIGSALLARVREDADRAGAEAIDVTAVAANSEALRMYERAGFVPAFIVLRDTRRRPGA